MSTGACPQAWLSDSSWRSPISSRTGGAQRCPAPLLGSVPYASLTSPSIRQESVVLPASAIPWMPTPKGRRCRPSRAATDTSLRPPFETAHALTVEVAQPASQRHDVGSVASRIGVTGVEDEPRVIGDPLEVVRAMRCENGNAVGCRDGSIGQLRSGHRDTVQRQRLHERVVKADDGSPASEVLDDRIEGDSRTSPHRACMRRPGRTYRALQRLASSFNASPIPAPT